MPGTPPLQAAVSDADLEWISGVLGLAPLDGPRVAFLKSRSTLDVAACPGSGKTTLVVAKLALLASTWQKKAQGICVLSHTNVAREEIEHRLGGTSVGGELLRYPHYIDTIHGFANRFLASPWLQSRGYRVIAIDNDLVARVRRKFLGERNYRRLSAYLSRWHRTVEGLRLVHPDFDLPLGDTFPAGPASEMYGLAAGAVKDSAERGYFRHDEMFVFANALLEEQPSTARALRQRFPFVLIDEMQDTTTEQLELLNKIFRLDDETLCVQRVGDPNQAIFEGESAQGEYAFPSLGNLITLDNSFRFDATIARLANGMAKEAISPLGLVGLRDRSDDAVEAVHTIFLFDEERIDAVMEAYGRHVLETFPDDLLRTAKVAAAGLVHKPADSDVVAGHKHFPKTVSNYWRGYQHKAKLRVHRFDRLHEYVVASQAMVSGDGQRNAAADLLATGFLKMANIMLPGEEIPARGRCHQQLIRLLEVNEEIRKFYQQFLVSFVYSARPIAQQEWNRLVGQFRAVAVTASGGAQPGNELDDFLLWSDEAEAPPAPGTDTVHANVLRVISGDRSVEISVSSIHAIKGETHLATLVVETFSNVHFFKALLPWLLGAKTNGNASMTPAANSRLFAAYVAMTRPTNLLCLAIPASAIGVGQAAQKAEQALRDAGWELLRI